MGATSFVTQPGEQQYVSECGEYTLAQPPFTATDKKKSKVFEMVLGQMSLAEDVVHLNLPLQVEVTKAHTVQGITNNVYSINKLVMAGYIPIIKKEQLSIYDSTNTHIKISRKAVLEGWLTEERMWCIPLVHRQESEDGKIVPSMEKILASCAPPTNKIANVYNKTTHPEICRYYYAAAGFPIKPTWLAVGLLLIMVVIFV